MKFSITFKDPDGPQDSVDDAVRADVEKLGLASNEEQQLLCESRREKVWEQIGKWFEYQEYVTIDIDTDADTATVRVKS